jgi:uncharacterized membrane protein YhaH (DUF805 family)
MILIYLIVGFITFFFLFKKDESIFMDTSEFVINVIYSIFWPIVIPFLLLRKALEILTKRLREEKELNDDSK